MSDTVRMWRHIQQRYSLVGTKCNTCGDLFFPSRVVCPNCRRKGKLEPFNEAINTSYEKINNDKKFISEIKLKTMKNAGNIILKRLRRDNMIKTIKKLKKYIKLKNSMNSLELLFNEKKNTQQIYNLINQCKDEINKIKEINDKKNDKEKIIEIFK